MFNAFRPVEKVPCIDAAKARQNAERRVADEKVQRRANTQIAIDKLLERISDASNSGKISLCARQFYYDHLKFNEPDSWSTFQLEVIPFLEQLGFTIDIGDDLSTTTIHW